MAHRRRAVRLAFLLSGIGLMLVCAVAQTSSRFTPMLVKWPTLLFLVTSAGVNLMLLAALVYGMLSIWLRRRRFLWLMLACVGFAGIMASNDLAKAFQISLAGLIVGSSLILLGCFPSRFLIPKRMS